MDMERKNNNGAAKSSEFSKYESNRGSFSYYKSLMSKV